MNISTSDYSTIVCLRILNTSIHLNITSTYIGDAKVSPEGRCYNFKRNYVVPYSKESHLTLNAFVTSPNHSIVLGKIFCGTFIERCFLYAFFLNSRFLLINLIR